MNETEKKKPTVWKARSSSMIYTPGMLENWKHMARTGDRRMALGQIALAFAHWPTLLCLDMLDGRIQYRLEDDQAEHLDSTREPDKIVVFEWDGPLAADVTDYCYEWKAFLHNVGHGKLDWLEAALHEYCIPPIAHRRIPHAKFSDKFRLEVPEARAKEAHALLSCRIHLPDEEPAIIQPLPRLGDGTPDYDALATREKKIPKKGRLVGDIPDDDPVFADEGAAWDEANVDVNVEGP